MAREEMYLHQRSRVSWLIYGDRNSKFFHTSLVQKRQRNQLLRLKALDGTWKESKNDINAEIGTYFSSLYQDEGPRELSSALAHVSPLITEDVNEALLKTVGDFEIKTAVFQLGTLKAPGSDGYPGLFFQKFWGEINVDTSLAVTSSFQGGYLLKKLTHTNIVLILKVVHPESLAQFRPISLCNFTVKIISKVLANRLKKILNSIISPYQSAYVPGRKIQDNILVAHEAFHFLKRKKRGKHYFATIKLDLSKAYDQVQWDLLEAVLRKMGFSDIWIQWTLQIIPTVTANGKNRFSFLPQRGIRQGDPLSPYLFLLVMDVFSPMIHDGIRDKILVA